MRIEKGESSEVVCKKFQGEVLTPKDEAGDRWREYSGQVLKRDELREVGDGNSSVDERVNKRISRREVAKAKIMGDLKMKCKRALGLNDNAVEMQKYDGDSMRD